VAVSSGWDKHRLSADSTALAGFIRCPFRSPSLGSRPRPSGGFRASRTAVGAAFSAPGGDPPKICLPGMAHLRRQAVGRWFPDRPSVRDPGPGPFAENQERLPGLQPARPFARAGLQARAKPRSKLAGREKAVSGGESRFLHRGAPGRAVATVVGMFRGREFGAGARPALCRRRGCRDKRDRQRCGAFGAVSCRCVGRLGDGSGDAVDRARVQAAMVTRFHDVLLANGIGGFHRDRKRPRVRREKPDRLAPGYGRRGIRPG